MNPQEIDTRIAELLELRIQAISGSRCFLDEEGNPINAFFITKEMRETKVAELDAELETLEAIYNEKPWTRWELVSGGKLHNFTQCQTLDRWTQKNPTRSRTARRTEYALTGMTWEEATEATGVSVCTKCCPEAK